MKVFIDFDDVIFNTKQFSASLINFFERNGVDQEMFKLHYYDPKNTDAIKLFDPEGLFSRLEKHENINTEKLREFFSEHLNDLSNFVFPDVEKFLKEIGRENIFLISFGLPVFQNEKIMGAGIDKLVNGCIITKGLKSKAIRDVIAQMKIDSQEKIIFIDDRVEQIKDIKEVLPESHTIFICRKEGRYCDQKNEYCDHEVRDLEEARGIISKL